jgi:CRISPR-associated endonuclease Csn1
MKKKILGLDLGTNSIGWALVELLFEEKIGTINGIGSRIIPMTQDVLGKFNSGISISQTAERTGFRGVRRLLQRDLLRRERLHRVLNVLDFLPTHYAESIDFERHLGQFKKGTEPKLVYKIAENGKHQFLFMDSFFEMVEDFKKINPHLLADEKKLPLDWTIYYLRKKALTDKIKKEELAWLLLNFNQKRGYYQLRGEDEGTDSSKLEEFHSLVVNDVIDTNEKNKLGLTLYKIVLENGWEFIKPSKNEIDWKGKIKEFIITTEFTEDGITPKKNKDGKINRTFRSVDSEKDWIAIKKKTEIDINKSRKTVGCYIYETLLQKPSQKINGKLVRTIERQFYKKELAAILTTQTEFHPELKDSELYTTCIEELYPFNEAHKSNIKQRDFNYLFLDDIIFYQRPLKSKISLISNCPFETKHFIKDGKAQVQSLKCIAKSHPLFQEFRLLQFVKNLKIYEREKLINNKLQFDVDITNELLHCEEDWEALLNWLNDKYEITQKQLLAYPKFKLKEDKYRWNFVEDKAYPCNETRSIFLSKSSKLKDISPGLFNEKNTEDLWHILYSVTDKIEIEKAIKAFAKKHKLTDEKFVSVFSKLKPYDKDYGAFSARAIKKLLPLMRMGNHWSEEAIDKITKGRIDKILTAEYDEKIKNRVREKAINLTSLNDFKRLPLWFASYIVYDRHSEASDIAKWKTPADIDNFLKNEFKQHSLRNPIVEQVITETLRVVKDIWVQYGESKENFFDEIHIELGREMKNPADKRKRMTEQISQNENTNLRIKALLSELKNDGIKDIRPYSPSQQEILKIYEEGVYQYENRKDKLEEVDKIRKSNKPSKAEIIRYKLWLEQGYVSPYTGKTIPLSQLFSTNYQIEHIFPQSRFFDDSMANKIICESEVNQLKDNKTALEFIIHNKGSIVELNGGGSVKLFTKEEYEIHIQRYFAKNKIKQKNLLSEDIPEGFINRQLNDSRYISKVVKNLLSKIVREEKDGELEQEATSKNIVTINGAITSRMKQDWGLNDVWNEIITPRFERLNVMTNSNDFGNWENKSGKQVFQTAVPDEIAKGFSKKRIHHRHHALDALVIACLTKDHVNYLNSINSERKNYSLVSKLRQQVEETRIRKDENGNKYEEKITVAKNFIKPWETFTQDTKEKIYQTVVSFKQNTRVINKTNNKYQKWIADAEGNMSKEIVKQTKGDNWAIRKPLHAETVSGKVFLKRVKQNPIAITSIFKQVELITDNEIKKELSIIASKYPNDEVGFKKYIKATPFVFKGNILEKTFIYETIEATATRKKLDISFDKKKIESITDTGIQRALLKHLEQEKYQNIKDENDNQIPACELAFSEDGLDEMNKSLLNHKPIYKVRIYEEGNRFAVGHNGNKKDKYVEAAKGTNLFFAIYQNKNGNRNYKTIPLNEVIESQKMGLANAPETDENENQLLFTLSPNDLVYIPTEDEKLSSTDFENITKEKLKRVYKIVSFTGNRLYGIPNVISTSIVDKFEFTQLNKIESTLEKISIKEHCWKIKIDRLGKIYKLNP